MTTTRRVRMVAPVALLALGTLAGCGQLHPGVAVEAGDTAISNSDVDQLTDDVCTALAGNPPEWFSAPLPMQAIRGLAVRTLASQAIADDLIEEYDVTVDPAYGRQLRTSADAFPAAGKETATNAAKALLSSAYFASVAQAAGRASLVADGTAEPTDEQVQSEAGKVVDAWVKENGLETDPRYEEISFTGEAQPLRSQTSVPVSDEATAYQDLLTSAQPDPKVIEALPASQKCTPDPDAEPVVEPPVEPADDGHDHGSEEGTEPTDDGHDH